jgi:hypothetical protein
MADVFPIPEKASHQKKKHMTNVFPMPEKASHQKKKHVFDVSCDCS